MVVVALQVDADSLFQVPNLKQARLRHCRWNTLGGDSISCSVTVTMTGSTAVTVTLYNLNMSTIGWSVSVFHGSV